LSDAKHADVRICVVGDGLVAGIGDARALGWVGRVSARTPRTTGRVTTFALGIPGEASPGLLARWRDETARRFDADAATSRLVVGVGREDVLQQVSMARSRLNLANVLDDTQATGLSAFVVGPPPTLDPSLNERLATLSTALADVAGRRGVPYVETFAPLAQHEDWLTDLTAGDGLHPGQAGYGLMAWLVLHGGWNDWLGLAEG
jgi:lysophospholipase L1-like esterase